jgi:hypothetical protein
VEDHHCVDPRVLQGVLESVRTASARNHRAKVLMKSQAATLRVCKGVHTHEEDMANHVNYRKQFDASLVKCAVVCFCTKGDSLYK